MLQLSEKFPPVQNRAYRNAPVNVSRNYISSFCFNIQSGRKKVETNTNISWNRRRETRSPHPEKLSVPRTLVYNA